MNPIPDNPGGSFTFDAQREALYQEMAPLVRRLIYRYGTTPELSNDLIGSLYCRFCALLDAYEPQRGVPLRPYLVKNLSLFAYSLARRHWLLQHREISLEGRQGGEDACPFGYDPMQEWVESLDRMQVQIALSMAMETLSERQRQVVTWRYVEECSFSEIAARLDIQGATARSTLRNALHSLRRTIERAQT